MVAVGDRQVAISWEGQGTLVCDGQALNPVLRIPDDLSYGSANECWVEFPEGASNKLRLQCNASTCTVSGAGATNKVHLDEGEAELAAPSPLADKPPMFELVASAPPQSSRPEPPSGSVYDEAVVLQAAPEFFAVQAVALADAADVDRYVREHRLEGTVRVVVESGGALYHAVIVGIFPNLEQARVQAASVRGTPPWIRRVSDLQRAIRRGGELREGADP